MMRFVRDALITFVLLALIGGGLLYVQIREGGLSADAQPGRLERAVATRLVRLSIPADAERQHNPFRDDASTWRSAVAHFEDHCAVCHGRDGRGKTAMGENLYPKVPDLAASLTQGRSDGALFHIIQNGVRWTGMPAWKGEHSPEDTWKLVSLIRKMPSLTDRELDRIEKEMSSEPESKTREKAVPHQHKSGSKPHTHR
jgi:mono/diheme cytochrome c family protein